TAADFSTFGPELASYQNPSFLQPLRHTIDPDGPSGRIHGLIAPAPPKSAAPNSELVVSRAVTTNSDRPRRTTVQRWFQAPRTSEALRAREPAADGPNPPFVIEPARPTSELITPLVESAEPAAWAGHGESELAFTAAASETTRLIRNSAPPRQEGTAPGPLQRSTSEPPVRMVEPSADHAVTPVVTAPGSTTGSQAAPPAPARRLPAISSVPAAESGSPLSLTDAPHQEIPRFLPVLARLSSDVAEPPLADDLMALTVNVDQKAVPAASIEQVGASATTDPPLLPLIRTGSPVSAAPGEWIGQPIPPARREAGDPPRVNRTLGTEPASEPLGLVPGARKPAPVVARSESGSVAPDAAPDPGLARSGIGPAVGGTSSPARPIQSPGPTPGAEPGMITEDRASVPTPRPVIRADGLDAPPDWWLPMTSERDAPLFGSPVVPSFRYEPQDTSVTAGRPLGSAAPVQRSAASPSLHSVPVRPAQPEGPLPQGSQPSSKPGLSMPTVITGVSPAHPAEVPVTTWVVARSAALGAKPSTGRPRTRIGEPIQEPAAGAGPSSATGNDSTRSSRSPAQRSAPTLEAGLAYPAAGSPSSMPALPPTVIRGHAPAENPLQRTFDTSTTAAAHRDPAGSFDFEWARSAPAAAMVEGAPATFSRPAAELPVQRDFAPSEPMPSPEPPLAQPVQRTDSPAAAAGPPTGPAAAVPGLAATGTVDIEDLARRLYDPLSARLKAELRLDRERAGLITDVRH
ncbi:MAG: hypothetical protein QOE53_474, partial [Pseudonocardiales bacterium]|nr:hypothetical protein [Pseudonocardiales bacterium]